MIEHFLWPDTKIFADIPPFFRFDTSINKDDEEAYLDYDIDINKIRTRFDNGTHDYCSFV